MNREPNQWAFYGAANNTKQMPIGGKYIIRGGALQNKAATALRAAAAALKGGSLYNKAALRGGALYNKAALRGGALYNKAALRGGMMYNKAALKGGMVIPLVDGKWVRTRGMGVGMPGFIPDPRESVINGRSPLTYAPDTTTRKRLTKSLDVRGRGLSLKQPEGLDLEALKRTFKQQQTPLNQLQTKKLRNDLMRAEYRDWVRNSFHDNTALPEYLAAWARENVSEANAIRKQVYDDFRNTGIVGATVPITGQWKITAPGSRKITPKPVKGGGETVADVLNRYRGVRMF